MIYICIQPFAHTLDVVLAKFPGRLRVAVVYFIFADTRVLAQRRGRGQAEDALGWVLRLGRSLHQLGASKARQNVNTIYSRAFHGRTEREPDGNVSSYPNNR